MTQVPKWLYVTLACSVATVILAVTALTVLGTSGEEQLPVVKSAPAFTLVDQNGAAFTDEDLRGKVYLTSFIFTNCTDICPGITLQMKALQERFRRAGLLGEVELLSISVDPNRDTPEVLHAYAAQYEADTSTWRFGTPGNVEQLVKVVQEGFLLPAQRSEHDHHSAHATHEDYMVIHSDRLALVDQAGQIRAYYSVEELDPDGIIRDIKSLR